MMPMKDTGFSRSVFLISDNDGAGSMVQRCNSLYRSVASPRHDDGDTFATFAAPTPHSRLCHRRSEDGYVQTGLCWHHFGLCLKSMSPVETLLQLGDGRDYFVHAG